MRSRLGKHLLPLAAAGLALALGAGPVGAQDADDPAQVAEGKEVYTTSCAGCHGADGEGSDAGRALIGVAAQQPDRTVHVASVTDGKGGMPAFDGRIEPEQIEAAVSYVRLTFVTEAEAELPRTGGPAQSALLGAALLVGGAALIHQSRRPSRINSNSRSTV